MAYDDENRVLTTQDGNLITVGVDPTGFVVLCVNDIEVEMSAEDAKTLIAGLAAAWKDVKK